MTTEAPHRIVTSMTNATAHAADRMKDAGDWLKHARSNTEATRRALKQPGMTAQGAAQMPHRLGNMNAAAYGLARAQEALEDARTDLVSAMREAGDSWAEVGEVLGVSKQAAQQRYGK